jgi:predicted DNA-binding transcriptional regulator AlpA
LSESAKMTGPARNPNPFDLLIEQIRDVVREEIAAATGNNHQTESEQLLTPEQAAELIGVNSQWLYRHAEKLPFTRRISRKNLRFSEDGLRRWLATKKPDSRR